MDSRTAIIGHQAITGFLSRLKERDRVGHAYLFLGPSSVGKAAVAAWFLRNLLELKAAKTTAEDPWAALRSYSDFMMVERLPDPKTLKFRKNISVEQVRTLRSRLSLGSLLSSWKVGVIDEAQTMSEEASNALLKTLEEPEGKTIIILLASGMGALPATLVSRCQIIRFHLVPERLIREGLLERGASVRQADEIAARAAGRPGAALSLFGNESLLTLEDRRAARLVSLLGAPVWQRILLAEKELEGQSQRAKEASLELLDVWESVLRDALVAAAGAPALMRLLSLRDQIIPRASGRSLSSALQALSAVEDSRQAIAEMVSPRLALEHALLAL